MKPFAVLEQVEQDRPIDREQDREFFYHLENALLLALKEQGRLNAGQYRHAAERLKQQVRYHGSGQKGKGK